MEGADRRQQPIEELTCPNFTQGTVESSVGGDNTVHGNLSVDVYPHPSSQASPAIKSPFRCNLPTAIPHYKGRSQILDEIFNHFTGKETENPTDNWGRTVALVGLGGMGKSATACQFAKTRTTIFPNAVWINAETEETTSNGFLSLAQLLEIVPKTTKEADLDLVQKVYRHIDAHYKEKVLLIFDNAVKLHSDGSDFGIFDYLPTEDLPNQRFPFVIIISLTPDWQKGLETFRLNELTEEESVEVFRSTFNVSTSQCDEDFKKLHFHLQGYPLAMNIVTSRIKNFNSPWDTPAQLKKQIALYMERFEKEESEILTTNQISLTVRQLFKRLEKEPNGDSAVTLLQASSFFNNPPNIIKAEDLQQVFTECHLCPGTPKWVRLPRLIESIRLLQKYYAANCEFDDMDSTSSLPSGHHRSLRFELRVHRLLKLGVRFQMECSEVFEDILRYLAFWTCSNYSHQLNMPVIEEALGRLRLTSRALTYVGLMACRGNPLARNTVQTRSARVEPAATIWRLYHLDKDVETLNEDGIGVLRRLVGLSTFGRNVVDKRCFARMALEMFYTRRVFWHVRDDGTAAPGIYLESFKGIEDLATAMFSTGCSFNDVCTQPLLCGNWHRLLTSDLTVLLGKQMLKEFTKLQQPISRIEYIRENLEVWEQDQTEFETDIDDTISATKASAPEIGTLGINLPGGTTGKGHAKVLDVILSSNSLQQPREELKHSKITHSTVQVCEEGSHTVHGKINIDVKAQASSVEPSRFRCSLPYPSPHFNGRAAILNRILDHFSNESKQQLGCWGKFVALVGLGGMGKSETACQFAKKYREIYPNVAWIHAETKQGALDSFLSLAKSLGIVSHEKQRADVDLVKKVYRHIDAHCHENVLFIFDNATQLHSRGSDFGIWDYLPTEDLANQRFPFVIITSQIRNWTRYIMTFMLHELNEKDSISFFRSTFHIPHSECDQAFKMLHRIFQGYPLAMTLAASAIDFESEKDTVNWLQEQIWLYVQKFQKEDSSILSEKIHQNLPIKYNRTLSTVWQLAFQRLQKEPNGANALKLLQAISFFHVPLTKDDLARVFIECPYCPGTPDWMKNDHLEESIRLLQRFHLVDCVFKNVDYSDQLQALQSNPENSAEDVSRKFEEDAKTARYFSCEFRVHRLVQLAVRQHTDCSVVVEDILRFLAFWTTIDDVGQLNVSAVEEALGRTRLSLRALAFVGLLALQGNRAARRIVQTTGAPVQDPAATIWRVLQLDKSMKTLNGEAIEVFRAFVGLSTSAQSLIDKRCFAYMALDMFYKQRIFPYVHDDGTSAPGILIESYTEVEGIACELLSTGCAFTDVCSLPLLCTNVKRSNAATLTVLVGKAIIEYLNNAKKSESRIAQIREELNTYREFSERGKWKWEQYLEEFKKMGGSSTAWMKFESDVNSCESLIVSEDSASDH